MDDSNDPDRPSDAIGEGWGGLGESILDENAMFEALAHERRRYLIYTLLEDDECSLEDLAEKVAAWHNDIAPSEVDEEEATRVYSSLYHAHVPKLADLGIVEFDADTETIIRGPNAETVLDVLEQAGGSRELRMENHARGSDND